MGYKNDEDSYGRIDINTLICEGMGDLLLKKVSFASMVYDSITQIEMQYSRELLLSTVRDVFRMNSIPLTYRNVADILIFKHMALDIAIHVDGYFWQADPPNSYMCDADNYFVVDIIIDDEPCYIELDHITKYHRTALQRGWIKR